MAKDKSDKEKKKEKKRSKEDGVHKPSKEDKKAKKEKKAAMAAAVEQSDALADAVTATIENGEAENVKVKAARPLGALVPFANPLADEKVAKKVLKNVKKGMQLVFDSYSNPSLFLIPTLAHLAERPV